MKKIFCMLADLFRSIKNEGAFARSLVWNKARFIYAEATFKQVSGIVNKIINVGFIWLVTKSFEEKAILDWIKRNWLVTLIAFVAYRAVLVILDIIIRLRHDRFKNIVEIELETLKFNKIKRTSIGTRINNAFSKAKDLGSRCSSYDVVQVAAWPVNVLGSAVSTFLLITTVVWFSFKIGLVLAMTSFVLGIFAASLRKWGRNCELSWREDELLKNEYSLASSKIDATLLGIADYFAKRSIAHRLMLNSLKLNVERKISIALTISMVLFIPAVIFILQKNLDLIRNSASFSELAMTAGAILMTINSIRGLAENFFGGQEMLTDIANFKLFLNFPDEQQGTIDATPELGNEVKVHVHDVVFAYKDKTVIKGISLDLIPGEAVVLIGANGSGKTTLVCIIANVLRPRGNNNRGCVMYNNHLMSQYTTDATMQRVALIPQKGYFPDLMVMENMFGTKDLTTVDNNRLKRALQMSAADSVLNDLPDGLHTMIGNEYNKGTQISGGQEQRLRLAAFFYRSLAPEIFMVIADEPGQNLDVASRKKVYQSLISLAKDENKIVVVITHDPEIQHFDRMITLHEGTITGDHYGEDIPKQIDAVSKLLANDV